MDEPAQTTAENKVENAVEAEAPPEKLTPLQAIRQKQAALQQHRTGGGKGGGKAQASGQSGAAASRKPTTGRQSYGGNS